MIQVQSRTRTAGIPSPNRTVPGVGVEEEDVACPWNSIIRRETVNSITKSSERNMSRPQPARRPSAPKKLLDAKERSPDDALSGDSEVPFVDGNGSEFEDSGKHVPQYQGKGISTVVRLDMERSCVNP